MSGTKEKVKKIDSTRQGNRGGRSQAPSRIYSPTIEKSDLTASASLLLSLTKVVILFSRNNIIDSNIFSIHVLSGTRERLRASHRVF